MNELNEVSRIHAYLHISNRGFGNLVENTEQTKPIRLIKTLIFVSSLITIYFQDSE